MLLRTATSDYYSIIFSYCVIKMFWVSILILECISQDEAEVLNLLFEGQGTDRTSEFQVKSCKIEY